MENHCVLAGFFLGPLTCILCSFYRMHFDELEAFAQYRTSPIGYEPFVEACIRKGNKELALRLIPKVKDPQSRSQLFASLGREEEAAAALRESPQQGAGGGILQAISGAFSLR